MSLRACVIGCGMQGQLHAEAWKSRKGAEVVSVYDPSAPARDQMAQDMGAKAYDTFEQAILHDGVDVVSVCTPTCFHCEVSCFASECKRHVLCEKPLAGTIEEIDAMIAAAKRNDVLLSIAFQRRDFPHYRYFKTMFETNEFGGPIMFQFTDIREVRPKLAMHRQSMNKGVVVDMAPHYFDLMRFITGENPTRVFASGHIYARGKERVAGIDDLAIDACSIEVQYGQGHILSMRIIWGMPEGFEDHEQEMVVGPNAIARTVEENILVTTRSEKKTIDNKKDESMGPGARINNFADAVLGQGELEATAQDGRIATLVSLGALESIKSGQAVQLQ